MAEYQLGDVVVLKSGSDKMTIEQISEDSIICVWINKAGKQERAMFAAVTLKPYTPPALGVSSVRS